MTDATGPRDRPPEPGLFVVWAAAEPQLTRILSAIDAQFDVRRVTRVRWTPERVDENFARFYRGQVGPPYSSVFSDQKGRGPFTTVFVRDPSPCYELRDTPRGRTTVNANVFDAKQRFRAWTGGGMRVHATDTVTEATRDSLLLVGRSPVDVVDGPPTPWDGTIEIVQRDLAGAHGWSSLREMLRVLNSAVTYVVLRNFEPLPEDFVLHDHADIDLLTDDYDELIRILGARPVLGRVPRWGGRFVVRVGVRDVIVDVRFVGDGYYDPRWARRLLQRRRLVRDAFHAPSDEDYFETLAYHAVVHKRQIARDYRDRLARMADDLGRPGWARSDLDEPSRMPALVSGIMDRHGYEYVRPRDPTVFFNHANVGASHPWLRRKVAGARREFVVRSAAITAPLAQRYRQARQSLVSRARWLRKVRKLGSRLLSVGRAPG